VPASLEPFDIQRVMWQDPAMRPPRRHLPAWRRSQFHLQTLEPLRVATPGVSAASASGVLQERTSATSFPGWTEVPANG
jgi:hypothetical protein